MKQRQALDESGVGCRDIEEFEAGGFELGYRVMARKRRGVRPAKRMLDGDLPHRDRGNENIRKSVPEEAMVIVRDTLRRGYRPDSDMRVEEKSHFFSSRNIAATSASNAWNFS